MPILTPNGLEVLLKFQGRRAVLHNGFFHDFEVTVSDNGQDGCRLKQRLRSSKPVGPGFSQTLIVLDISGVQDDRGGPGGKAIVEGKVHTSVWMRVAEHAKPNRLSTFQTRRGAESSDGNALCL